MPSEFRPGSEVMDPTNVQRKGVNATRIDYEFSTDPCPGCLRCSCCRQGNTSMFLG